jgi:uncharacterized protein (TIGR02145 family)
MKSLLVLVFIFILFNRGNLQTVTIGGQIWMEKNLDVSVFRNGDKIPHAKTAEEWMAAKKNRQPAWCYFDNDLYNAHLYGKLYNWYAVNDSRGLSPEGFHIPSIEEWNILTNFLGGETEAGDKLKDSFSWELLGLVENQSAFRALPGGCRVDCGQFVDLFKYGYWWSSTSKESEMAYYRIIGFDSKKFQNAQYNLFESTYQYFGLSVRCIKD